MIIQHIYIYTYICIHKKHFLSFFGHVFNFLLRKQYLDEENNHFEYDEKKIYYFNLETRKTS